MSQSKEELYTTRKAYKETHMEQKRAEDKKYHIRNKELLNAKAILWAKEHPINCGISSKKYKESHPERTKAHKAVHRAVKDGHLIQGICEVCGEQKTQAHHEDYSKPLEVHWLCQKHHTEAHFPESNRVTQ